MNLEGRVGSGTDADSKTASKVWRTGADSGQPSSFSAVALMWEVKEEHDLDSLREGRLGDLCR